MRPSQATRDGALHMPLAREFTDHITRTGLIPPASHVLVAVSGGLDSIMLLHLLCEASSGLELRLTAAHFDHAMRTSSADDAAFVRAACAALGVPCECGRATSILAGETAARAARYQFLHETAARVDADRIATAHHADDNVETVLFRLIRGTGLDGLAGIPQRRGILVRPLLPFPRARIVACAQTRGIAWRDDITNADPSHTLRNRIRHELLPALEQIRPAVRTAILAVSREAAEARAAWHHVIDAVERDVSMRTDDGAFQLARDALLEYHPHVRARVIRRLIGRLGGTPGRAATAAAVAFMTTGASGKAIQLPGGLRLERAFDRLVLGPAPRVRTGDRSVQIMDPRPGWGDASIGGRRVRLEWRLTDAPAAGALSFNPAALRFPLEARGWLPGDRIRLRAGTRKLKKLFAERRVPRRDRDRTPVLVQGDGRVLWAAGIAFEKGAEPVPGEPVFQVVMTDAEQS